MVRKLKVLGIAAVAVLAMSAVVASAAHAATGKLTATEYPATLTGEQVGVNKFVIAAGVRTVTCKKATFHGTIKEAADPVTLTPTYSECHAAPNEIPATVTMNGCDYSLKANTVTSTTGTLTADLLCPAGKDVEIHLYENATKHKENSPLCQYTVKEQLNLPAGEYHNEGSGSTEDVTATLKANPVTTVTKGSKILCGAAAGSEVAATLEGTATLKGEVDGGTAPIGILID